MSMGSTESRLSINRVWAKNFRSIEHAELHLGPLTVLVGPNASGKSNLLDVLSFLSDVACDGLETAINRRGGIDSVGRRSLDGKILSPEIGLEYELPEGRLEYVFALLKRRGGEYRVKHETIKLRPVDSEDTQSEIAIKNGRIARPRLSQGQGMTISDESGKPISAAKMINELIAKSGGKDLQLISPEPSPVLTLLAVSLANSGPSQGSLGIRLHHSLVVVRNGLAKIGLYHIFPNSLREPQKAADSYPLTEGGENLASILRDMIQKRSRFYPELRRAMSVAVPGITDIRVTSAGSYYVVELKHERDGGNGKSSWFDLSHESDGTIRLLAMLTALFQDPAPSLTCLEEPELAIHPGAMAVLSDTMEESALRGQVLVATHSPDLIDRFTVDCIRAVTAEGGSTKVGAIADHQLKSVKQDLFSPGELHSMEGLQPVSLGE